jgi:hypothetical protein
MHERLLARGYDILGVAALGQRLAMRPPYSLSTLLSHPPRIFLTWMFILPADSAP